MYRKLGRLAAITIVGAGLVLGTGTANAVDYDVARAAAVVQPSPNTVGAAELKAGAVWGSKVQPNTLPWGAFGAQMREDIKRGDVRKPGSVHFPALDAELQALLAPQRMITKSILPTVIEHIGGPHATNKTKAGELTLPDLGSSSTLWQVTVNVVYRRTVDGLATDPAVRPQTQIVYGSTPAVTTMGVELSKNKGRELMQSATGYIMVGGQQKLDVNVFGYDDLNGSTGSGQITAEIQVWALEVRAGI